MTTLGTVGPQTALAGGAPSAATDLYRTYWDASVDGLFAVRVTPKGEFRCAGLNPALEQATGLRSQDTAGRSPETYFDRETADILLSLYRACLAAEAPVSRTETLKFPGGVRVCIVSAIPVFGPSGRIELLLGRAQDVTEVREMRAAITNLTERLLDVQEEERRRIAAELHDSTSQHLVAVQLELAALRRRPLSDEALSEMHNELAEAHREIRTLSYLLSPPRLAKDRLTKTLQDFTQGFAKRAGMSVDLRLEGAIDSLPHSLQRALFRVTQEALANAHRHGQATQVHLELCVNRKGLRLAIIDDGRSPVMPVVPGVGLSGMQLRMERFGGSLSLRPTTSGAAIVALIPPAALNAAI